MNRTWISWISLLDATLCLVIGCSILQTVSAQFLQQGSKLTGTGAVGQPLEGSAVALSTDGNTLIVSGSNDNNLGAVGSVWFFTRTGDSWVQQGPKLAAPGAGRLSSEMPGSAVALSGDGNTAIVGAPGDNNFTGAAWVFVRSSGVWRQEGSKLVGSGALGPAQQGLSVAISADGNTAIVGGPFDNNETGAAWVFVRSSGVWRQQGGKLLGTGAAGAASQGRVALSADGNTAIVGGPNDNHVGALWVFTRLGNAWSQQGDKIVASDTNGGSGLGISVSLSADGSTAITGGRNDGGSGAAWVFTQNSGVWAQQGTKLVGSRGPQFSGNQGSSVAISGDGNIAVIGGPLGFGAAWTFERISGAWRQLGDQLVGADVAGIPSLGTSVSISGDGNTIAVGGPLDSASIGATWIFVRSSTPPVFVSGVVNQASGTGRPVAPGEVVVISGANFGPGLTDNTVQIDGIAAPVLSASTTQIVAVTPFALMPGTTASLKVRNKDATSAPVALQVSGAAPGLYSADGSGTGQGLIFNADGSANSPSSPAFVGDVIAITGTGGGQTNPPSSDGTTTPDPPPILALQVTVTFGGVTVYNVVSATGLAGEITGKFAIAVAIPDGVGTGDVPVVVSIANVSSQDGLTVNIGDARNAPTSERYFSPHFEPPR